MFFSSCETKRTPTKKLIKHKKGFCQLKSSVRDNPSIAWRCFFYERTNQFGKRRFSDDAVGRSARGDLSLWFTPIRFVHRVRRPRMAAHSHSFPCNTMRHSQWAKYSCDNLRVNHNFYVFNEFKISISKNEIRLSVFSCFVNNIIVCGHLLETFETWVKLS